MDFWEEKIQVSPQMEMIIATSVAYLSISLKIVRCKVKYKEYDKDGGDKGKRRAQVPKNPQDKLLQTAFSRASSKLLLFRGLV